MNTNKTNNSKQAAWVALGSLFSFLVGIISPMILSRYFDKPDYGTYKQVMYVYNTLLAIFTLGLPKAYSYFLPKFDAKHSRDIINKITSIFWILGLIFSLLLYWGADSIARILSNPDLRIALRLFAPVPLFMLPTMGFDSICASFQKTRTLAFYTIITKVFIICCTVLPVVLWNGDYKQAIIGFDIASAVSCILALYFKNRFTSSISPEKSILTIKEIFSFSIPLLYASIWGMIIASSTQFFISRYYGNDVFADFSNGFMENPFVGMIINAIATVLLPAFSKMTNEKGIQQDALDLWSSSVIKSAKVIFPMLLYSIFFAKTLMTCMYGDQYSTSSSYFIIKNIGGLFYIIPFAPIILAIGRTKAYAMVHMIIAAIIILLEFIIVKTLNLPIAVAVIGECCNVLKILMISFIISKFAKLPMSRLYNFKALLKIFLVALLASLFSSISFSFISMNKFVVLVLSTLLFMILYALLCKLFKITYLDIVASFIPSRFNFIYKWIP